MASKPTAQPGPSPPGSRAGDDEGRADAASRAVRGNQPQRLERLVTLSGVATPSAPMAAGGEHADGVAAQHRAGLVGDQRAVAVAVGRDQGVEAVLRDPGARCVRRPPGATASVSIGTKLSVRPRPITSAPSAPEGFDDEVAAAALCSPDPDAQAGEAAGAEEVHGALRGSARSPASAAASVAGRAGGSRGRAPRRCRPRRPW